MSYLILEMSAKLSNHDLREFCADRPKDAKLILFSAICFQLVTSNHPGIVIPQTFDALVALCKCFEFRAFTMLLVSSISGFTSHQRQLAHRIFKDPRVQDVREEGGEILEFEQNPHLIIQHIISKAKPFHIPQESTNWVATLINAKAQLRLQIQPPDSSHAQELQITNLESELKQSRELYTNLLASLALPADNLELKDLAKEFDGLNRDISRFVKIVSKHFMAGREIGVDKLLVEPHQLENMHKLLDKRGDPSSASLYLSKTNRHMSVKLFLHNAIAHVVCDAFHKRIFRLFYPDIEPSLQKQLARMYTVVQDNSKSLFFFFELFVFD